MVLSIEGRSAFATWFVFFRRRGILFGCCQVEDTGIADPPASRGEETQKSEEKREGWRQDANGGEGGSLGKAFAVIGRDSRMFAKSF